MSRGMKISLAVAAVLLAALGLYSGVFRSGSEPADFDTVAADTVRSPVMTVPRPTRIAAPTPDSAVGGILSESITQATAPRGANIADSPVSGSGTRPVAPLLEHGPPPSITMQMRQPAPKPQLTNYQVKAGDSMSSIAQSWLGDATRWQLIAAANPGVDPMALQIGQTLKLPVESLQASALQVPVSAPLPTARGDDRTHVVGAGDNLSWIANRYYGDVDQWTVIYEANRTVIGSDPDTLVVGTTLVIPPASG